MDNLVDNLVFFSSLFPGYELPEAAQGLLVTHADIDREARTVMMTRGIETVKEKIEEIKKKEDTTAKDDDLFTTLEVCYEFYLRGFTFARLDLYKSHATKFLIEGNTLIPPFVAVAGLGETAAWDIMARETINAIREAEAEASQREKDARAGAETRVTQALADAEALEKRRAAEAEREAEQTLEDAKVRADRTLQEKRAETDRQIAQLRQAAMGRFPAAVDALLQNLTD